VFSTEPTVEKAARLVHGNPRGCCSSVTSWLDWRHGPLLAGDGNDRAFGCKPMVGAIGRPTLIKDCEQTMIIPHLLWGLSGAYSPIALQANCLPGR